MASISLTVKSSKALLRERAVTGGDGELGLQRLDDVIDRFSVEAAPAIASFARFSRFSGEAGVSLDLCETIYLYLKWSVDVSTR